MTTLRRRDLLLWPLAAGLPCTGWTADGSDPNAWLEAVDSTESLAWVRARNAEALTLLAGDPDFERRRRDTLAALSAPNDAPFIWRVGPYLYNSYRTARRPRGILRRTTVEEYAKPQPAWQTVLDLDALEREEKRSLNLAWTEVNADNDRALVFLSVAGEDKTEVRELDLQRGAFVPGGFHSPTAKQSANWFGPDELLIATFTGPDSVTDSGYARVLRRWKRGTDLRSAPEILRCERQHVQVYPNRRPGEGVAPVALLNRRVRFYETERFLLRAGRAPEPLALPLDANAWLEAEWLVVWLRRPWERAGVRHAPGSVLVIPLAQATNPAAPAYVALEGLERRRLLRIEPTRDGFVVAYMDNMVPQLVFQRWTGEGFEAKKLPAPASGQALAWEDRPQESNRYWLVSEGPITPQVRALLDADRPGVAIIEKKQPAHFDASGLAVQKLEARSRDGTLIPYTVIAPARACGPVPTVLYGYGGFGLTVDEDYQRLPGINWLRYGGALVLAHIRGGGEFGEAWYQAAKGMARQTAFDDFIAIAEDLVRRGTTTPRQLGIHGASNGGALVAAVMVQRPELFGAVVSRVPLTDMLRFSKLFAGASWMEEYGDPDQAPQRAVLAKWSPYQNAKEAAAVHYPPVLFIGNRNDDRVHPSHARKMAARLRELGHERTWLYEEAGGGHSGRSDPHIHALREAIIYTFMRLQLGAAAGPAACPNDPPA